MYTTAVWGSMLHVLLLADVANILASATSWTLAPEDVTTGGTFPSLVCSVTRDT